VLATGPATGAQEPSSSAGPVVAGPGVWCVGVATLQTARPRCGASRRTSGLYLNHSAIVSTQITNPMLAPCRVASAIWRGNQAEPAM